MYRNCLTYTDYLIVNGYSFNPETVIFDATKFTHNILYDKQKPFLNDEPSLPPFPYCNVEFEVFQTTFAVVIHLQETSERVYMASVFMISLSNGRFSDSTVKFKIRYDENGIIPDSDRVTIIAEPKDLAVYFDAEISLEDGKGYFLSIVTRVFAAIHARHEFELVTAGRNRAKRIIRKTGKQPSPYFMLAINPNKPRKRYIGSEGGGGSIKRAMHTVRGHFRTYTNHPRIPNQTVFVRPHIRGLAEQGQINKGYKIVLDKQELR